MPMPLQNGNVNAGSAPTTPRHAPDLSAASECCDEIRRTLERTLTHAKQCAWDLQRGLAWSGNLERFETASMEMVRLIARFPIRTTDDRFGALVHRARAAVVAFRETVRREVVGVIDATTDDAACDMAIKKINARSVLAAESLASIEHAITQQGLYLSAAVAGFGRGPFRAGAAGQ